MPTWEFTKPTVDPKNKRAIPKPSSDPWLDAGSVPLFTGPESPQNLRLDAIAKEREKLTKTRNQLLDQRDELRKQVKSKWDEFDALTAKTNIKIGLNK